MAKDEYFYSMVFWDYLNVGLLDSKFVLRSKLNLGENIPLNAAEGFIRQVIGWRESSRDILREMPAYLVKTFKCKESITRVFWSGDTKMACLKAIEQTHEEICTIFKDNGDW